VSTPHLSAQSQIFPSGEAIILGTPDDNPFMGLLFPRKISFSLASNQDSSRLFFPLAIMPKVFGNNM